VFGACSFLTPVSLSGYPGGEVNECGEEEEEECEEFVFLFLSSKNLKTAHAERDGLFLPRSAFGHATKRTRPPEGTSITHGAGR
jgi:hypothetical protein